MIDLKVYQKFRGQVYVQANLHLFVFFGVFLTDCTTLVKSPPKISPPSKGRVFVGSLSPSASKSGKSKRAPVQLGR